ncbi:hypothetical protein K505DRAFT_324270 [Melanomma pulvis-pyrius CBS 109.77]|uniref:Uncharacterized protein n=1 Tax=Melanomma pulvis-pyrius CBS 109.77 TaxID=1314802 RepID=A0A6A6XGL3_9PLEO|nr:hypothetical protein K505DRAFT_324270 [Melanomma pulvis-pyrius CBS 109.77]
MKHKLGLPASLHTLLYHPQRPYHVSLVSRPLHPPSRFPRGTASNAMPCHVTAAPHPGPNYPNTMSQATTRPHGGTLPAVNWHFLTNHSPFLKTSEPTLCTVENTLPSPVTNAANVSLMSVIFPCCLFSRKCGGVAAGNLWRLLDLALMGTDRSVGWCN